MSRSLRTSDQSDSRQTDAHDDRPQTVEDRLAQQVRDLDRAAARLDGVYYD